MTNFYTLGASRVMENGKLSSRTPKSTNLTVISSTGELTSGVKPSTVPNNIFIHYLLSTTMITLTRILIILLPSALTPAQRKPARPTTLTTITIDLLTRNLPMRHQNLRSPSPLMKNWRCCTLTRLLLPVALLPRAALHLQQTTTCPLTCPPLAPLSVPKSGFMHHLQ